MESTIQKIKKDITAYISDASKENKNNLINDFTMFLTQEYDRTDREHLYIIIAVSNTLKMV